MIMWYKNKSNNRTLVQSTRLILQDAESALIQNLFNSKHVYAWTITWTNGKFVIPIGH